MNSVHTNINFPIFIQFIQNFVLEISIDDFWWKNNFNLFESFIFVSILVPRCHKKLNRNWNSGKLIRCPSFLDTKWSLQWMNWEPSKYKTPWLRPYGTVSIRFLRPTLDNFCPQNDLHYAQNCVQYLHTGQTPRSRTGPVATARRQQHVKQRCSVELFTADSMRMH